MYADFRDDRNEPGVSAPAAPPLLSVLRHRTYRRLFTAQVVALVGTGLLTVALGLLAYDIAGGDAGLVLGTALTIKILVYVVGAPTVTAVAAKLPVKPVLITADLVRASIAVCLPFVHSEWQLYVAIFLLQAASATFTPTFQSVIPQVLPDEDEYTNALSLSRMAYDVEQITSPAVAALFLAVMSYHNLFIGTMLGFLVSAALVIGTRLPARPEPESEQSGFLSRVFRGARIMAAEPELRGVLWLNLAVAAPMATVMINTVVIVRGEMDRNDTALAITLAGFGLGSMLTALALPRILTLVSDLAVMTAGALAGAAALAGLILLLTVGDRLDGAGAWFTLIVLWLVLGSATSALQTPMSRVLRRNVEPESYSYIFAAQFSLSHACYLATYPAAGFLGVWFGLPAATGVLLAMTILAVGAGFRAFSFRQPVA
ncbi:MFS transporter [Corynebacterium sp. CCM 8835]|uniref:MFS transporter n=1 Tax=Corynebacterium antarcticum TaxID=2800405 RepID=A0A9Q4GL88_9CORY|nr:MFS transporter [Corynebacterium antarcticum]MCK7641895.1 MFS transporter [Corynebacterium antarcticum]MCK7659998.1 MFS transporter [Corynebacterium antarcticum]MCL0245124.1 MFS transporter [Corynebacterium antarcticum]MCX7537518.1 MFS transporter [Corynebacterium antarcticum]MCX7539324.1 MFS transporter [Corynebacterium antarcticum]